MHVLRRHLIPPLTHRFMIFMCTMRSATLLLFLPLTKAFSLQASSSARPSTSLSAYNEVDRRSAILQGSTTAGLALSSLLLSPNEVSALQDYDDSAKKRILITGSNSGIGMDAAQRMALRGHEVVLACVSALSYDVLSVLSLGSNNEHFHH